MRTEDQLEMLAEIKKAFPRVAQIASYAGAKFVLKKSPEDLKRIREAGLSKLYMGVESGDPVILERICKGVKAEETLAACLKLKEAGFMLSTTIVQGLGGKERFKEHAVCTAKLLNKIQPDELRLHTLMLEPGAPLYDQMERGEFVPCGPKEIFQEARFLVENLDLKCRLYSHGSNYLILQGRLPQDRQKLLDTIDEASTEQGRQGLRLQGILRDEEDRAI
jgi:radical SAM superfamily enzyme